MKKYDALYRELKEKILSGEYRAGEKLPSKRVMADKTALSLITVETAYAMLEDEGYLTARERSGYYVCRIDAPAKAKSTVFDPPLVRLPEEEQTEGRDFEYSVWFKTIRRVIAEQGERLFIKAPAMGCPILRNAIAEYLLRYRGMRADPARIVIGSGSEQLYEIAVKLLGREKIFGIEHPCYEQIPAVYKGMGAKVLPLSICCDGIDKETLLHADPDILHVTPFHSYPSGVTTSISKRLEYLRWAEQRGRYILEDDFDSEFFVPGHPIESLYALDHGERVIYMNTFSKSLSSSMRLGYMILPEALMPTYEERLGQFSCSVPVLDQYVLAEFIAGGNFERHLNRMRRKMRTEKTEKNERSLPVHD